MKKVILSGGPHTGKTTLLDSLRASRGEALHFVDEPAAMIISAELKRAAADPTYEPIVPTQRYSQFVDLVVAKSVELEADIPDGPGTALLDRSLIDNIGYARLNGRHDLVPDLIRWVEQARYAGAFICDFVGTYTQTDVRPETEDFAHAIHEHLLGAYADSSIPVVHLPAVPVEQRVGMVLSTITSF